MHSVITRKGQVTIPKEIRDHLKAKEGEKVAFVMRGDEVILRMVRGNISRFEGQCEAAQTSSEFRGHPQEC